MSFKAYQEAINNATSVNEIDAIIEQIKNDDTLTEEQKNDLGWDADNTAYHMSARTSDHYCRAIWNAKTIEHLNEIIEQMETDETLTLHEWRRAELMRIAERTAERIEERKHRLPRHYLINNPTRCRGADPSDGIADISLASIMDAYNDYKLSLEW